MNYVRFECDFKALHDQVYWCRLNGVVCVTDVLTSDCSYTLQKRAKSMVDEIGVKYSAAEATEHSENYPSATLAPPTPRHYNPTYQVFPHPSNSHIVMDSYVMPRMLTQPVDSAPQSFGIITDIEINRKGGLSCPVRTGAVLACCHSPATSIMHTLEAAAESMIDSDAEAFNGNVLEGSRIEASVSDTAKEACAQALDELETTSLSALRSCDGFRALKQLIGSGMVPALHYVKVHRSHSFFQGVTVEFEPPKHGFSKVLAPTALMRLSLFNFIEWVVCSRCNVDSAWEGVSVLNMIQNILFRCVNAYHKAPIL